MCLRDGSGERVDHVEYGKTRWEEDPPTRRDFEVPTRTPAPPGMAVTDPGPLPDTRPEPRTDEPHPDTTTHVPVRYETPLAPDRPHQDAPHATPAPHEPSLRQDTASPHDPPPHPDPVAKSASAPQD